MNKMSSKVFIPVLLGMLAAFAVVSCSSSDNEKETKVTGNRSYDIDMVYVKGGTFTMGSTNEPDGEIYSRETPAHSVTLNDFYICKFEVTQGLWNEVMGSSPSYFTDDDNLPVEQVSWEDCQMFIQRLNDSTGKNYRLPTEAEWEYAALGGSESKGYKYSGSDSIVDVAWCWENSEETTHPVGTKQPNELGIYDMSGNVWEWCSDLYDAYGSGSQVNPIGSETGSNHVLRGGSWRNDAKYCRVKNRFCDMPNVKYFNCGFRLVLSK